MSKEAVVRYVKAGAAALACAGIMVTEENQAAITMGFMAVYSVAALVHGKITKK